MERATTSQSPPRLVPRMGIHSHINNGSSHGSSNIVVANHLLGSGDTDVLDKAVVVGERAAFQRANCATLVERLRRLQPLLDEVRDSRTLVSEPGFESVEGAVVKARELVERCGPHASRLYMVS